MSGHLSRRSWIGGVTGAAACSSGLLPRLAKALENEPSDSAKTKHCIILWMPGGPSQMDTFDMKPDHANGGEFKEIQTASAGLRFSEHLPKLAKMSEHLAIIRGLSTKEGDHQRATELMRTGHRPGGPVDYPAFGCSLAKVLESTEAELPGYLSVSAGGGLGGDQRDPGFLGPKYAATPVLAQGGSTGNAMAQGGGGANPFAEIRLDFLTPGGNANPAQRKDRLELRDFLEADAAKHRTASNISAHRTVYARAIRMMQGDAKDAFDLSQETDKTREAYGRGTFGQGCLLARRLVEREVPLVEVTLGNGLGWDTHADNFNLVKNLSEQLDAGWSMLMQELSERGLLESTTILWAGEFGRTPKINANGGRDHFPQAWTCALAGGGIQGGGAWGKTSEDGMEVVDGKVSEQDVLTTLCEAMGIPADTEHYTPEGRPLAIAEGTAIRSLLS